jgi:hypothetical protein
VNQKSNDIKEKPGTLYESISIMEKESNQINIALKRRIA